MSIRYKFDNPTGVYFISFAMVCWTDVHTRMAKAQKTCDWSYCHRKPSIVL